MTIKDVNVAADARLNPDKFDLAKVSTKFGFVERFLDESISQTEEIILGSTALADIANADEIRTILHGTGEVIDIFVRPMKAPTTGAKTMTLTASLGAVAITGAAGAFTSAGLATAGVEQSFAATAANVFTEGDVLKLVAGTVTAFVEGTAQIGVRVRRYAKRWFTFHPDGGSVLCVDAHGGEVDLVTGASDNDEVYLVSSRERVLLQTGKPFQLRFKFSLTEANTDDANFIMGFVIAALANTLQDNGAGPPATYDGAVVFKVDGGTVMQFETSNAGTQVVTTDIGDFTSGTTYVIDITYDGVTTVSVAVDGTGKADHTIAVAGLEEMHVIAGVKAGGANAETLKLQLVALQADV